MKNVKILEAAAIEGLVVKNLKRFPSMEWGEEGGLEADLYYEGEHMATIYNAGDGGPAEITDSSSNTERYKQFKAACYKYLVRRDPSYGPNTEYDWLKNKSETDIDAEDMEAVILSLEERHDDLKTAKKILKKDEKANAVVVVANDWQKKYFSTVIPDPSLELMQRWVDRLRGNSKELWHIESVIDKARMVNKEYAAW